MNAIEETKIKRAVTLTQALSHEVRLQICAVLLDGEASVTSICDVLTLPQHKVSQQLAILRHAEIVATRRQSRQIFYTLADNLVGALVKTLLDQPDAPHHSREGFSFEAGRFAQISQS
ncbi:MAG: ArsR/SmtB family transcription factor [Candidatus Puniceispirillales bacterium]